MNISLAGLCESIQSNIAVVICDSSWNQFDLINSCEAACNISEYSDCIVLDHYIASDCLIVSINY